MTPFLLQSPSERLSRSRSRQRGGGGTSSTDDSPKKRSRSLGAARHYDWDTYHFFPDVHDEGLLIEAGSRASAHRPAGYKTGQYVEDEWLKEMEEYMRQVSKGRGGGEGRGRERETD